MNWEQMIEMRRHKESTAQCPFDARNMSIRYLSALDLVIGSLSHLERRAIELRFVSPRPIARVADLMGMSWDGANELIDRAALKISKALATDQIAFIGSYL